MKRELPWEIIISRLRGNLTDDEAAIFGEWILIGDNEVLFKQLEKVWHNIQHKVSEYEPDLEYYWKEMSARIARSEEKAKAEEVKTRYIPIRKFYTGLAAASVALVLIFSGLLYVLTAHSDLNHTQTYTSINGKSKISLPDGSTVWLHSNTTLTYMAEKEDQKREVKLDGEAYFDIKHDEEKPFYVKAGDVSVRVLGTEFNVNAYGDNEDIEVSLHEGSVAMMANNKTVKLRPGEEGKFDADRNSLFVKKGDVDFAKSWTSESLRFENKNLREVCRYLSKWYSVDIIIDKKIPDNQLYTFTLRTESLEEVARILSRINSINYKFDEDNKLYFQYQ